MQFIYTVVCYPWYDGFLSNYEYIHCGEDFDCGCDLFKDVLVLTCDEHPFLSDIRNVDCSCKTMQPTEICRLCSTKRLIANFEAIKTCFKNLRKCDEPFVCIKKHPKKLKVEPFFEFVG